MICKFRLTKTWFAIGIASSSFVASAAITSNQVGIVINDQDPYSVEIGEYYRVRRNIPTENIVHVSFAPANSMTEAEFAPILNTVKQSMPSNVEALAIAWVAPYKVACASTTAAFTLTNLPCKPSKDLYYSGPEYSDIWHSNYFNAKTGLPNTNYGKRISMMLAASTVEKAKELIDRGVASDNTNPNGPGYSLISSDKVRSLRSLDFNQSSQFILNQGKYTDLKIVEANNISNTKNIVFYFGSTASVMNIGSNTYAPGAIADHLTSYGGMLTNSSQMSSLAWIDAGVTGSYGTVVEPYALSSKFPNISIVTKNYLNGDTLIEAYWKSVETPYQGIFIGEPLAKPFNGKLIRIEGKYGLQAGVSENFSASFLSGDVGDFKWEMPDGSILNGESVNWTPPTNLASIKGTSHLIKLTAVNNGVSFTRQKSILIGTEKPGVSVSYTAEKPVVFEKLGQILPRLEPFVLKFYNTQNELNIFRSKVSIDLDKDKYFVDEYDGYIDMPRYFVSGNVEKTDTFNLKQTYENYFRVYDKKIGYKQSVSTFQKINENGGVKLISKSSLFSPSFQNLLDDIDEKNIDQYYIDQPPLSILIPAFDLTEFSINPKLVLPKYIYKNREFLINIDNRANTAIDFNRNATYFNIAFQDIPNATVVKKSPGIFGVTFSNSGRNQISASVHSLVTGTDKTISQAVNVADFPRFLIENSSGLKSLNGYTNQSIKYKLTQQDESWQLLDTKFNWSFPSDATVIKADGLEAEVVYATPGTKNFSIKVSNASGSFVDVKGISTIVKSGITDFSATLVNLSKYNVAPAQVIAKLQPIALVAGDYLTSMSISVNNGQFFDIPSPKYVTPIINLSNTGVNTIAIRGSTFLKASFEKTLTKTLTANEKPTCTFDKFATPDAKGNTLYKLKPKCADVDGRPSKIMWSYGSMPYKVLSGANIYLLLPNSYGSPVIKVQVMDNLGLENNYSIGM